MLASYVLAKWRLIVVLRGRSDSWMTRTTARSGWCAVVAPVCASAGGALLTGYVSPFPAVVRGLPDVLRASCRVPTGGTHRRAVAGDARQGRVPPQHRAWYAAAPTMVLCH